MCLTRTPSAPPVPWHTALPAALWMSPTALRALVEANDVTTYEIEAVDTTTLLTLEAEGHCIWPSPRTVATIRIS